MSEDSNHYVKSLRNFIQNEFRAEIRDQGKVVLDCLVCKHNPSPSCRVCFPVKEQTDGVPTKTKRMTGYSSASHFHSVGKNNGTASNGKQYVDLSGDPITEETLNNTKQMRQMRKLQQLVTDLRSNVQRLEMEKMETMDALKQVSFVCSNMRNRQRQLDLQVQQMDEELQQRDYRIRDLEDSLRERDAEIRDLRVRCATSESCRSNATKELKALRQQLNKQSEHLSLFSVPTFRGSTAANLTNSSLRNCQGRSYFNDSSLRSDENVGDGDGMNDFVATESVEQAEYQDAVSSENREGFNEWRSYQGDVSPTDGRDNDTVVSNTTANTFRSVGTFATNNTTPMHPHRPPSAASVNPVHSQTLQSQHPPRESPSNIIPSSTLSDSSRHIQTKVMEVAEKIDPQTSGIGTNVLTHLIKGVEPNELIKQNNIRKYIVADAKLDLNVSTNNSGDDNRDNMSTRNENSQSMQMSVEELGEPDRGSAVIENSMTGKLLKKQESPQDLIKKNNLQRYQAQLLPNTSQY